MYLYLVEHAEAKPAEIDPARGLTAKGAADVRKVTAHLRKLNLETRKIYHSGKTRAYETASILAAQIKPAKGVVETDGLGPQDDPQIWYASMLLCGDPEKAVVHFKTGGIVCLTRLEENWSLEWAIAPDVLG